MSGWVTRALSSKNRSVGLVTDPGFDHWEASTEAVTVLLYCFSYFPAEMGFKGMDFSSLGTNLKKSLSGHG